MALKYIGERTVGTLNGMKSGFVKDDLYRIYDAGILVTGGVAVDHGDFVSWDGTKWKKEASIKIATTDLVEQADKFEIFEASDSGGSSVFPTYAQITAALADGKIPVLKRTNLGTGNTYFYICSLIDETNHAVWFRGLQDSALLVVDSNDGWADPCDIAKSGSVAFDYTQLTFPVSKGTYCMHDGYLYYCSVSGGIATSEPWTPAHWTGTNVTSIIGTVPEGGSKTGADLVDGTLAIDGAGSWTSLTLTTEEALTLLANEGTPNFAITVDNSGNANDVEVTVKTSDGTATLKHSVAGGTTIAAGSVVQITAVGDCWTLASFEA